MLIIAGYLEIGANRRDEFVAAHHDLLERGRAAPGCLDLAISADPLNPRGSTTSSGGNLESTSTRGETKPQLQTLASPSSVTT